MDCCTHKCNQGRMCPKENKMHILKTKKSHEQTPRVSRDAEYKWPDGSNYMGDEWRSGVDCDGFSTADVWCFTMILVAVVGAAAVVLLALVGVIK